MPLFLAGFVALFIVLVTIFNNLVAARRRCDKAAADIEVQLRQRNDLVPNLVAVVAGYAAHERGTLDEAIRARNAAAAAAPGPQRAQAEADLAGALWRLFALAEAYPNLKASRNFVTLQNELADVEYRLAASRHALYAAVTDYNVAREQFPGNFVAGSFGFKALEIPRVAPEAREKMENGPKVGF